MLDPERRAEHVDLEHPAEVGGLGVDDQARDLDAGVVDEDVEPAELLDRRRDGGLPRRLVADVEVRGLAAEPARGLGREVVCTSPIITAAPAAASACAMPAPKPRAPPVTSACRPASTSEPSVPPRVGWSARTLRLRGPAGDADDAQHQHAVEGLVAVLREALGQPGGERRPRGVALEAQLGPHPPQL